MVTASPDIELHIVRRHPAQREIVAGARRFNVLNCGRRFGKDVLGIDLLIDRAIEGRPTAWFAPTYKNLTEDWRALVSTLAPVILRKDEQEQRLDLIGRGTIECWSLDRPNTARGRAYARIVINEAAQVPNLQEVWEQIIRPTLADYRGDAWFLSTPKGFNYFKALYDRGQDPEQADWRSWTFPTAANPFIDPDEIEAARRELPESTFGQEYLASFVEGSGAVFQRIREAATATPQDKAVPGHAYVIGCDWGKLADFTALAVLDLTTRELVCLERLNQIDYAVQAPRLQGLCGRFHPALVIAETNSIGEPILEQLKRLGLPVFGWTASNATKAAVIADLQLAFEQGTLRILPDQVLISELESFRQERLPVSALMRFSAPPGQHDDTVIALALAWSGVGAVRTGPTKVPFGHRPDPGPGPRIPGRVVPAGRRVGRG